MLVQQIGQIWNQQAPFYLFKPQDIALKPEYEGGWKITDILLSKLDWS